MTPKTPAFFCRHYGANLPRGAFRQPRQPSQTLVVECDTHELEMRVAAWAQGELAVCGACGAHANEHGAINHPFVESNT